jgi:hypothetical protein
MQPRKRRHIEHTRAPEAEQFLAVKTEESTGEQAIDSVTREA